MIIVLNAQAEKESIITVDENFCVTWCILRYITHCHEIKSYPMSGCGKK